MSLMRGAGVARVERATCSSALTRRGVRVSALAPAMAFRKLRRSIGMCGSSAFASPLLRVGEFRCFAATQFYALDLVRPIRTFCPGRIRSGHELGESAEEE